MATVNTSATIHAFRPKLLKPEAGSEARLLQTSVAVVLGVNEALFLQQLNFRLRTPSHVVDGVPWYEAAYDKMAAIDFPFWSTKTIARTCRRLEARGIIIARPMSRNTYDRTKWYTINEDKLQEALGSTSGQPVPLHETPCPLHDEDNLAPSLEEQKREKKEPEGAGAPKEQEENTPLPAPIWTATVDTPPADAASTDPVGVTREKDTRTVKAAPTEKQKTCPHPFAEVVTLFDGTTICNHCYGLVSFHPLEAA